MNLTDAENQFKAEDKTEDSNRFAEMKPQVHRISFTGEKASDDLPDIVVSNQKNQNLNRELIDIGRKLRFIADQFEKQRSSQWSACKTL